MAPLQGVGIEASPVAGGSVAPKRPPPGAGEVAGAVQPKVARASSLDPRFLTCHPVAGGKGGGRGGAPVLSAPFRVQARRVWSRDSFAHAIAVATATTDITRARALYDNQEVEYPDPKDAMDAEHAT